jgi:hypothetical protein
MSKLDGIVAVITGGGSRIGLTIAQKFIAEVARVFSTGRRHGEPEEAQAAIGRNVTTAQGDAASPADPGRLDKIVAEAKGVAHIVAANAGFVEHQTINAASPEHFDKTFRINARGAYFRVAKALPLMTEGGAIVLVASGAHLKGLPARSASSTASSEPARRRMPGAPPSPARPRSGGSGGRRRWPRRDCSAPPTTAATAPGCRPAALKRNHLPPWTIDAGPTPSPRCASPLGAFVPFGDRPRTAPRPGAAGRCRAAHAHAARGLGALRLRRPAVQPAVAR